MGIHLSEKHGVNPSIEKCFFCLEDKGLILFGRMLGDKQAPMSGVFNQDPCDKCKEYMDMGVILISIDPEKNNGDMKNPWRTGDGPW